MNVPQKHPTISKGTNIKVYSVTESSLKQINQAVGK